MLVEVLCLELQFCGPCPVCVVKGEEMRLPLVFSILLENCLRRYYLVINQVLSFVDLLFLVEILYSDRVFKVSLKLRSH